ncbi:MAG TPA: hypothetical protein PLK12_01795 [Prolixibacteraceae bacterium]|nr:hypothetical protein [Prolixibacteraceae bacterium]
MPVEVRIKDRLAKVDILGREGTLYRVRIGDKTYEVDVTKVSKGIYSLIYKGHSINMEMIEGETPNQYIVNTLFNDYRVDVIDAKARYREADKSMMEGSDALIASPMPGKVVAIPVRVGESVKQGQTVVVVSAMKMESEYKSPIMGNVKAIFVKAGDTVGASQALVEIEPLPFATKE